MDKDSYFMARIVAYAESGCIAFAYDVNKYTNLQAISIVIEEFIEKYVVGKQYIAFGEGIILQDTIDLIAEQQEIDTELLAAEWEAVEAATSPEIYEALRQLYTMFDDKLISWYANLYDPGVGAYYATSSGRDHEGYLPDPESTMQALTFLSTSGMLDYIDGGAAKVIPKIMQHQLVYYAKSIQDPNGYFYNPIVTKTSLNSSGISRRGRDLGWCTSILSLFGSAPTYTTPTNTNGDGITADEYWESTGLDESLKPTVPKSPDDVTGRKTESLGSTVALAVSKVVSVSSGTEYLEDYELFIDYLHNLAIDTNPYSIGNELNATVGQIGAFSNKLEAAKGKYQPAEDAAEKYKAYAGMNMKEITIAFLNSKINPDTGLWGIVTASNPKGTEFVFTNGFFKMIGCYNNWGVAYPEPVKAIKGLLAGSVSDQASTGNICEVWNIWSGMDQLIQNTKNYASEENRAIVLGLIDEAIENQGAEAILISYQKQLGYKKPDGAYAHKVVGSTTSHQGNIPVGLGIEEGDVDAIGKATTGLVSDICSSFGIPSVRLYTESHLMTYLEILMNLDPVIKYSYDDIGGSPDGAYLEYDDMPSGSRMTFSNGSISSNTASVITEGTNGVLLLDKPVSGKQAILTYYLAKSNGSANSTVFETKMKLENSKGTVSFSIGPKSGGHDNRVARISLVSSGSAAGSLIQLYEEVWAGTGTATKVNGDKVIIPSKVGEWFTIKIEYYEGDLQAGNSRVKVSINGTTVYVSDDVYSKISDASSVNQVTFISMGDSTGKVYFDDTYFACETGTYVDEPVTGSGSSSGGDSSGTTGGGTATPETPAGAPAFDSDPSGILTFDDLSDGAFDVTSVGDLLIGHKAQSNATSSLSIVTEGGEKFLTMNKSEVASDKLGQSWIVIERSTANEDTTAPIVFEVSMRHHVIKNTSSYFRFYNGRTAADCTNGTKLGDNLSFYPSEGNVRVDNKVIAKLDEWYTLRFVLSGTTLSIYASDESGKMVKIKDKTWGADLSSTTAIVLMNDTETLHKTDFNYIYFGRNADLAASESPLYPVTPNASADSASGS